MNLIQNLNDFIYFHFNCFINLFKNNFYNFIYINFKDLIMNNFNNFMTFFINDKIFVLYFL